MALRQLVLQTIRVNGSVVKPEPMPYEITLPAGQVIDESQYDFDLIRAAGGALVPYDDTMLLELLTRVGPSQLDAGALVGALLGSLYWDDLRGSAQVGLRSAAWVAEEWKTTPAIYLYAQHNQENTISFVYQFPHGWARNSVRPHLHIVPAASGTGNVYWEYQYTWTRPGRELVDQGSWTTGTVTTAVGAADVFDEMIVDFGLITPPSWADASSNLHFHVNRDGTSGSDTYDTNKGWGTIAANVALLFADCHYQRSLIGSQTEFPT